MGIKCFEITPNPHDKDYDSLILDEKSGTWKEVLDSLEAILDDAYNEQGGFEGKTSVDINVKLLVMDDKEHERLKNEADEKDDKERQD